MKIYPYLVLLLALVTATGVAGTPFANFNGQAGDELAVWQPSTGNWFALEVTGGLVAFGENWGWDQTTPAPGDYNGDGATDLAVFERRTGAWFIKNHKTGGLIAFAEIWGDDSMISVPGDYNGDGVNDLAVYQPETGNWFIRTLGGHLLAFGENWGGPDMVPVPGDYNGDGKTDLGVYQRHTGNWFVKTLGSNQLLLFGTNWGDKGMDPVPGDYNGDGRTDLAVYQRATGNWFIRTVGGAPLLIGGNWGWNATQPAPGDYNGDGADDLAVYERATGSWFVRTLGGTPLAFAQNWGIPGASTPTQTYAHRGTAGQTILCFGDSITFGRGSASNGPLTGYPRLLERKLEIELGGMYRCLNFGVPGETTSFGINRINAVLNAVPYANALLLMEGTNDARDNSMFNVTDNNLRYMLETARARGLETFLSTIPPVIPTTELRAQQASRIRSFNSFIPGIAQPTATRLVQTYAAFASMPSWPAFYSSANHPNDAGYLVVRDAFFAAVQNWVLTGF